MNNTVNLGIIGCGHWGPNFVRNFSQMPYARVDKVCDINHRRLSHIKQLYPEIGICERYEHILNDSEIDAVVISTPAVTHYNLTKKALHKNKHVLIEKPIALKINEAGELIRLSKMKKRILMVGHTFLYNPAVNKIKSIIQKRDLGKIYYLHSRRTNLGPLRKDVSAMWDLAPHDISIFNYLLDAMPKEVVAKGEDYLQKGKIDVAFITLTYPGNIIANIHVSWLDPRKVREITIVGNKKMLVFDDLHNSEPLRVYDKSVVKNRYQKEYKTFEEFQIFIRNGKVSIPKVVMEEPMKIECRHFLECIRNTKIPLTEGDNGLNVLKVLIAIQKSLDKNGQPVSL